MRTGDSTLGRGVCRVGDCGVNFQFEVRGWRRQDGVCWGGYLCLGRDNWWGGLLLQHLYLGRTLLSGDLTQEVPRHLSGVFLLRVGHL